MVDNVAYAAPVCAEDRSSQRDCACGVVCGDICKDMPPNPCILIVHASVGSGHRSAALSIEEAFQILEAQRYKDLDSVCDIEVLDILDFARFHIDGDKTATMFTGFTRPIYDITWRYTLTGRFLWGGGTAWSRAMFPRFTSYVEKHKPQAIICTHITAANAAVGARMITGQAFPIVCVPTDYEVEGFWPHNQTDLFCVANEAMAETLRARKVPEKRILYTGIPVRAGFAAHYDADCIRQNLGLPLDKTIVLVMAGAHLAQPYVRFRETMNEVIPFLGSLTDMYFVFLSGKDTEYANQLRSLQDKYAVSNMTIMRYVTQMAELMVASDLAICKSGGLTVTECMCARLPMILLGRSYGQEKVNTSLLTSLGAAMHVTTGRELMEVLRHLYSHKSALDAMLVNGEALRRPLAAQDIAKATLSYRKCNVSVKKRFISMYWGDKPAHTR